MFDVPILDLLSVAYYGLTPRLWIIFTLNIKHVSFLPIEYNMYIVLLYIQHTLLTLILIIRMLFTLLLQTTNL